MANIIFWSSIFPIQRTRPIGCYQLAHHLRKNKITAQVIDFCGLFTSSELINLTKKFIDKDTVALGISTSFWPDASCPLKKSILDFKDQFPNIKIIFGGPRANNPSFKNLHDLVFVGESEEQLTNYMYECLGKDKSKIVPFNVTKLDHRFITEDCILPGEVLPIELGRGCIFKCKFCSHHNLGKPKYTYQRDFNLIEDEMKYNLDNFGTTYYLFLDDTVNEDIEKIKALAGINNRLQHKINWNGYLRADLIWSNKNSHEYLLASGLKSCFFGIESFHPKASAIIGKGWSGKHGKEFLPHLYNNLWNQEVSIWNNFIVGLPYETEKDIDTTVEWCLLNNFGMNRFVGLNLYLDREDNGTYSEFTRNFRLYGYKVNENGRFYNEHWTADSINQKVKEINDLLIKTNNLSSWLLFDIFNITKEDLKSLKTKKLSYNCFPELFKFKLQYKNLIEKL